MKDAFGFRAARIITMLLHTFVPPCSKTLCIRRATMIYRKSEGAEGVCHCDEHSGPFHHPRQNAALIREAEAAVIEANDRPSVRMMKGAQ